jgi:hypothetical protein
MKRTPLVHRKLVELRQVRVKEQTGGYGLLCTGKGKASGAIPISGTGTIFTSTRKFGPSSTTTPALHSLGISKDGVLIFSEFNAKQLGDGDELKSSELRKEMTEAGGNALGLIPRMKDSTEDPGRRVVYT